MDTRNFIRDGLTALVVVVVVVVAVALVYVMGTGPGSAQGAGASPGDRVNVIAGCAAEADARRIGRLYAEGGEVAMIEYMGQEGNTCVLLPARDNATVVVGKAFATDGLQFWLVQPDHFAGPIYVWSPIEREEI
jgi:hypothetical protein